MARLPRDSRTRAAVLILTVVVVSTATAIGPGVLDLGGQAGSPAYAMDGLVPDRAPADGTPAIERADEPGVVLVDTAHGNRIDPGEVRPLLATISAAGYEVDLLEPGDDLHASLARADAFVVMNPGSSYSQAETIRVESFVDRGGRLLLVGEPTQGELGNLGITVEENRLSSLASRFGFEFGEAYLYHMETNDGNHRNVYAGTSGATGVTEGVSRTAHYTATTVHTRDGRPVLLAADGTRSSRTDDTGTYPVAAVDGDVLAIGDGTFLQAENANVVDNERLIANIARFLVSGSKATPLATYPAFVDDRPRVHYTGPALLPAAQLLGTDLRSTGRDPRLSQAGRTVGPDRTDVLITTFDFLADRDGADTGIRATADRVGVDGYESRATGIIVIRAPADGYDLVIAADTPGRAELAAAMVAGDTFHDDLINDRTVVVRTDDAVRVIVDS